MTFLPGLRSCRFVGFSKGVEYRLLSNTGGLTYLSRYVKKKRLAI